MTNEEHIKKVVQMHALPKNIVVQFGKNVQELNVSKSVETKYRNIYFVKLDGECLTLEFIGEKFEKNMNNTSQVCVSGDDLNGQLAGFLSHFSYEICNSQLLVGKPTKVVDNCLLYSIFLRGIVQLIGYVRFTSGTRKLIYNICKSMITKIQRVGN